MTTSTVDPTQPSTGSDLSSSPVRNNFAAAAADINNLYATVLSPGRLRASVLGVNLNSVADTPIAIPLPPGLSRWKVSAIMVSNASVSLTTAQAGVFSSPGGVGQTLAAAQALSGITSVTPNTNNNMLALTLTNGNTESYNVGTIYFRCTTPQGSAATADVTVVYEPLT